MRLPALVDECAREWGLSSVEPFEPASISYVARVTLADGAQGVLKVNFPEAETEREAEALSHWRGHGAVRLIALDRVRRALLIERCDPGEQLWSIASEEEANSIAADILRRLWRSPPPPNGVFRQLSRETARWIDEIPADWEQFGRPFERRLVDEAVSFLRDAGSSPGDPCVLHQDFHGGNVLRADRGWLAIDPKPLAGERELDAASLLRDRRIELAADPAPVRRMRRRLDQLSGELDLDRERIRGWGLAHALAWGASTSGWIDELVACARWLSEAA